MFRLTPLAIALQGIGFATLLTALQGLVAVTDASDQVESQGILGAIKPKRRVRRWTTLASVPAAWEEQLKAQLEDEDLLLEVGAL